MQLSGLTSALLATAVSPVMSRNVIHQTQQPILSPQETILQPLIGFGTWNLKVSPENTTAVVSLAIETGYRQIDCAAIYGNQVAVGKGIKEGLEKVGLKREDIWVTSKLWNDHHGDYETAEAGLNQTLKDLGLDYLDLYLMHWPVGTSPNGPKLDYVDTWKSMIDLPKSKVLNIGISNFSPKQLKDIISKTGVKPAAHQMEMHPYLQQSSWLATHEVLGISVTAYSPLANSNPIYDPSTSSHSCHSSPSSFFSWLFGNKKNDPPTPLLKNPVLKEIAERRNCTTAQVALAWGIGRGTSVIPKSSHEQWIKEDYEAIDCQLGITDEVQLKALGVETVKRFSNPSKNWGVKLFEGLDGA